MNTTTTIIKFSFIVQFTCLYNDACLKWQSKDNDNIKQDNDTKSVKIAAAKKHNPQNSNKLNNEFEKLNNDDFPIANSETKVVDDITSNNVKSKITIIQVKENIENDSNDFCENSNEHKPLYSVVNKNEKQKNIDEDLDDNFNKDLDDHFNKELDDNIVEGIDDNVNKDLDNNINEAFNNINEDWNSNNNIQESLNNNVSEHKDCNFNKNVNNDVDTNSNHNVDKDLNNNISTNLDYNNNEDLNKYLKSNNLKGESKLHPNDNLGFNSIRVNNDLVLQNIQKINNHASKIDIPFIPLNHTFDTIQTHEMKLDEIGTKHHIQKNSISHELFDNLISAKEQIHDVMKNNLKKQDDIINTSINSNNLDYGSIEYKKIVEFTIREENMVNGESNDEKMEQIITPSNNDRIENEHNKNLDQIKIQEYFDKFQNGLENTSKNILIDQQYEEANVDLEKSDEIIHDSIGLIPSVSNIDIKDQNIESLQKTVYYKNNIQKPLHKILNVSIQSTNEKQCNKKIFIDHNSTTAREERIEEQNKEDEIN